MKLYRRRRLLFLVLCAAGTLRMIFPTLTEFKRDEATVVREALRIARLGAHPAFGVGSSLGTANAPLFLYLAALPMRLSADPVALVLFIALLNTAAVAATWWLARRYLSERAALIAAFLFAFSGWAVLYGRKVWVRTLPLFVVAFVAALLAAFVERRRGAIVAAFLATAVLVGLQLEGVAFVVILGLLLLLNRRRLPRGEVFLGAALFVFAFLPYLVADARLGWPNLRGLLAYAGGESHLSPDALRYAFHLVGSWGMEGLAGPYAADFLHTLGWTRPLEVGMMALLASALLHAGWRLRRGTEQERTFYTLLLVWFLTPILLQSYTSRPTQPHYFVLLYPAAFLLIAALLDRLLTHLPGRRQALVWGFLLLWGMGEVAAVGTIWRMMVLHPSTGGYGIPLRYPREAVQAAQRCAPTVVALGEGADPRYAEAPAVFDALLFTTDHRLADAALALPFPQTEATAFVIGPLREEDSFAPVRAELTRAASPWAEIRLADGTRYVIACRRRSERDDLLTGWRRLPADVPFADGVVFTAVRLPAEVHAGEEAEVWLAWWLREKPADLRFHQFYLHLLDDAGQTVAQVDANGYPVEQWRAGDLVLSRFPLTLPADLPPGDYTLRAGLYTLPDLTPLPVLSVEGEPIDDGVTLGKLSVGERTSRNTQHAVRNSCSVLRAPCCVFRELLDNCPQLLYNGRGRGFGETPSPRTL